MKYLVPLLLAPLPLFAHEGHPGPEGHGNLTHLMLGLALALPFLAGLYFRMRHRKPTAIHRTSRPHTD